MKDFFKKHKIDFIIAPVLITVGLLCNIAVAATEYEISTEKYGTDVNGNSDGINWNAVVNLATRFGLEKAQLLETLADELYYQYYQYSNGNAELAESIVTAILKAEKFYFETQDAVLTVKLGFQSGVEAAKGVLMQMIDNGFSPLYWGDLIEGDLDLSDMTTDITADDLSLPGEIFNDAVTSMNNANYYMPEPTSERKILSFQTQPYDSYRKSNLSSFCLPLRYGSDMFLGVGWSDVYLCPFIKDDDLVEGTYYGQYQFHLYHQFTDDNVLQLLMDVIPLNSDDGTGSEGVVLCSDVASTPFMIISPYCFGGSRVFNLDGYDNFSSFVTRGSWKGLKAYDSLNYMNLMSTQSYLLSNGNSLITASTLDLYDNVDDDAGYICQQTPFVIDYSPIPDAVTQIPTNYYITINGDNIYDYGVKDPETGESTTVNYYITNNNFPGGEGGSGSGTGGSSGDVSVGGHIDVSGKVDINVNVDSGEAVTIDDDVSLEKYYNWMIKNTESLRGFLGEIFSFLPTELLTLLGITLTGVCVARFLGR